MSPAALQARFRGLPGNVRGFVWILLAAVAFMAMVMAVRLMSADFNTGELAFWRALFGLALLSPAFLRNDGDLVRTRRPGLHAGRNLLHYVGIAGWYFAITDINLSVGMSLQFAVPLFTIVLAILCLGERVDAARWIATGVGLAGVVIILRPGFEPITVPVVACIVSAVGYAGANVATKVLRRSDSSDTVVLYMNVMHLPLGAVTALAMGGIRLPALADFPGLIAIGLFATLAHWLLAKALGEADASLVIVGDFTKLPLVTFGAFVFFGEAPVLWAWLGAAVIFAAIFFLVRREARPAAPPGATVD